MRTKNVQNYKLKLWIKNPANDNFQCDKYDNYE